MIARDPIGAETWLLSQPPTRRQTRWVVAIAACQVAAFALIAPFAKTQLPQVNGFIPAIEGVIFVTDLATSVLLFSQFAIHRLRALLVLACGYLLSALMIIPHALTFPGAFSPTGLLGAGPQTAPWLYWFWHLPFSLALLGYGLISDEKSQPGPAQASSLAVMVRSVALVLALAGGLTLLATAGHDYLPVLLAGGISRVPRIQGVAPITMLVCVSALAVLWLRRRSLLDQWLLVVALAAILETGLTMIIGRFTLGFYAGRLFSLLISTVVLVVLLVETMRLYANLHELNDTLEQRVQAETRERSQIWNVSQDLLMIANLDGKYISVNPAWTATLGWSEADLLGKSSQWLLHPDDRDKTRAEIDQLASGRKTLHFENRLRDKGGSYHWILWTAAPDSGRIYAMGRDISEQKRAQEALRVSERNLSLIINSIPTHIYVLNTEGSVRYVNQAVMDYTGLTPEDVQQEDYRDRVIHPEDFKRVRAGRAASLRRGAPFSTEQRVLDKDGQYRWFLVRYKPLLDDQGGIVRWYVAASDIEDRKRAENALRDSEERFRDYAETGSDWLWEMGPDYKVTRQMGNAFRPRSSVRVGTAPWERALDVETEPEKWRALRETMDSRQPFRDFAYLTNSRDGHPMYVRASGKPVFDADGEFLGYRGTGTDVTAIIRAQEALRESERSLREAIDGIPGLVGILAPDGGVEAVNRQIVEYTGQPLDELKNWGTNGTVHPDDLPHVGEVFTRSIASGVPYQIEQRLRRFDGEYRWFDNRGIPIRDDAGRIARWYVLLTDIEDRTQALARLQQMQSDFAHVNRVSTMGELAASLSHEILHPIATARNNARAGMRFMEMNPPNLDEAKEALGCVVRDADRARDIVARMRAHMKKSPPQNDSFELNEAVREAIAMVRSVIARNKIAVNTQLKQELVPVQGDRVQLQQVVVNLILNAVEAMSSLEEGARELSIRIEQGQAHGGVLVQVRDSGPGIDPRNLEQVFEPFYTTKTSGVGMGLSICRSIINGHGGRLWVSANEPRGAVFQFTLPPAQEDS